MSNARPILESCRFVAAACVLLAVGCGDDGSPSVEVVAGPESAAVVVETGDPLLARARAGIRDGVLPSELEAEVLDSVAVEHARARRVLLAMAEPPPGPGDGGGRAEAGADDGAQDPRLQPPLLRPVAIEEALEPTSTPEPGAAKTGPAKSHAPTHVPAPSRRGADLGSLALRSTKRGATLTIAAPSSLVVGVANQPSSGLVRLVIESARAGAAVLGARPKTEGAAVTGVRQGQGTVQITIALEPGWTLGSVQPFSGGAKVHLVAPR